MKGKQMSKAFLSADRTIVSAMKWVSYLAAVALALVMILAVADVISAKFFSKSIPNATEYIQYLNVAIVFLAMAYVQVDSGHTTVDIFYTHFPKAVQWIIHFVFYLGGIAINGFFGWRGIVLMMDKMATHARSSQAIGFLLWPFVAMMSIGLFLVALANVWCAVRACVYPQVFESKNHASTAGAPTDTLEEET